MNNRKITIIGAGTMGRGIATVFANAGYEVLLVDVAEEYLSKAMAAVRKTVEKMAEKKTLKANVDTVLGRIKTSLNMEDASDSALVVEAIVEVLDEKKKLFAALDKIVNKAAILASNTSSISITLLASQTNRKDKVIGMHFFNPVHIMKLVEVVMGEATSTETLNQITEICKELEKVPVSVSDYPGFVANRILMPYINEGIFALYENVATKKAIDTVAKLGFNHPMGPLELADLIGLDVCYNIMMVLYNEFGDSKYRPCPLLKKMVYAGKLGRKSGEGFYKY